MQGCRIGSSCHYVHQYVHKEKCNLRESETNTKRNDEHENHIDVDVPFEEVVRQTVIKI